MRRIGVFVVLGAIAACGEEGSTVSGGRTEAGPRDAVVDAAPAFDALQAIDASVGPGPGRRDAAISGGDDGGGPMPSRGEFLDDCTDNGQCRSGFCVPWDDRNVCTQRCLEAPDCPDDWVCRAVQQAGPDPIFLCVRPGNRLCGVCLSDDACPNGRCYALDGQDVCGADCLDDDACPTGYACRDVFGDGRPRQCVPTTQSCTCSEARGGEQRLCEVTNDFGTCYGRETCDSNTGWTPCNAQTPAEETCNLADDDCNGFTDDVFQLGEICTRTVRLDDGEQDAGVDDVIECTGRVQCTRDDPQPVCTAPEPMREICNFLDDDCDGAADEGFEDRGQICVEGIGECRRVGVLDCSGDGAAVACDTRPGDPQPERCDGFDNDCDGNVDESFPALNDICSTGEGACRRSGAVRCAPDGQGTRCTAEAGEPGPERCDGVDNDCDGQSDELFEGLFEPCNIGVGACQRTGFRFCSEDELRVECNAVAAPPSAERCNRLDDDCDGAADETFPDLQTTCEIGVGRCRNVGVLVCADDEAGLVCSARAGEPVAESCNGLDDDCDGAADEDEAFANLAAVCNAGVGACLRTGVYECSDDGAATICNAVAGAATEERCNAIDDDCDGASDEDFPDRLRSCTAGVGACERAGVFRCGLDGSSTVCDASAGEPAPDRCDGLDNDCDGTADEDWNGLDAACSAGTGACLRTGILVCGINGVSVVCNAIADEPGVERCNGLDDDCDGQLDEGPAFADQLEPCEVGLGRCKRNGFRVCRADGSGTECNAVAAEPEDELCDGLDNDCDEAIDEGFEALATPCFAGLGLCQRAGVRVCGDDGTAVICNAVAGAPVDEICDGFDNDCDGATDEDEAFEGKGQSCVVGVGACQRSGVIVCAEDGQSVECDTAPGAPVPERCDAVDNDCDGAIDETFEDLAVPCEVGVGVCQRIGIRICNPAGDDVICTAQAGEPGVEACNGADDDCDGLTDEGFVGPLGLNTTCDVGVGVCARTGIRVCSEDGSEIRCSVAAGEPTEERCDALDNDCDGITDEGFTGPEGVGTACVAGRGACRRNGVRVCAADGTDVVCNAAPAEGVEERCNAIDDDCDGAVDETFDGLDASCEVGIGACHRTGVTRCSDDGSAVVCSAEPGTPVVDICNRADDDCDGAIDEDFGDLDSSCVVGVGACQRHGIVRCAANPMFTTCDVEAGDPAEELCDGVDNDCDGAVDEDFDDLDTPCAVGVGVCRRHGIRVCNDERDAVVCNAETVAGELERCDGLDNDCDGTADETFVSIGHPCTAGVGTCERPGVVVCASDASGVECNASAADPVDEVCDGLDNDCDGATDEIFDGLNTPCEIGLGVCRQVGVVECTAGGEGTVCGAIAGEPRIERCDALDNDCDGDVDEDWPQLGELCQRGVGLCRRTGRFVCDDNSPDVAISCDAELVAPGLVDACDFQDDDCDGATDEDFVDGAGRYVQLEHCGVCGTSCLDLWNPDPETFGVAPRCGLIAELAQCTFDCLPGFFDADRVAGNGCELEIDPLAIYVSTRENGGVTELDCGTVDRPCGTVTLGIQRAVARRVPRVRVSDGVYRESISLEDGVNVLGGHHRTTWIRDPELNVTFLDGRDETGSIHRATVRAIGIDEFETVLDGFVINGESPLADGNSYAIYVRDSDADLVVSNNRIFAGAGGVGSRGTDGTPGTPGAPGDPGSAGRYFDGGGFPPEIAGGPGGAAECDGIDVNGGVGGDQTLATRPIGNGENQAASGVPGEGPSPGTGGAGAYQWYIRFDTPQVCRSSGDGPIEGFDGQDGDRGSDADGASGAPTAAGVIQGAHWRGLAGGGATAGGIGSGGGGGGAAAGVSIDTRWDIGSTGGGGGSGGCAGGGGIGGTPGGGSFGIFVIFETLDPTGPGGLPRIAGNLLSRGLGGRGGDGGNGGAGGEGGRGGDGGAARPTGEDEAPCFGEALCYPLCAFSAGAGGEGGRGGHGGGAGGGQGGASFDIFIAGDARDETANAYHDDNDFTLDDEEITAGLGGSGGNASNTEIGLGGGGDRGPFGRIGRLP